MNSFEVFNFLTSVHLMILCVAFQEGTSDNHVNMELDGCFGTFLAIHSYFFHNTHLLRALYFVAVFFQQQLSPAF